MDAELEARLARVRKATASWPEARRRAVAARVAASTAGAAASAPWALLAVAAGLLALGAGAWLLRGAPPDAGPAEAPPPQAPAAVVGPPVAPAPAPAPAVEAIRLPLEVLGPEGTRRTIPLHLSAEQVARARALRLRVHGLRSGRTATLRLNESRPLPLANDTVEVAEPARRFEGIGGALTTVDLAIALAPGGLVVGANELAFTFVEGDGVASGFRVLAVAVADDAGADLLAPGTFLEDHPARWRPLRADPADYHAGERLWRTAALSWPERGGTRRPMTARCGDCHAQDGRDLKYFGYSDQAIVARSQFYGLGVEEAERIATYIRRLPVPALGRPWNPPYQPGPGLDAQPVERWAAGAGLEAVVTQDRDALAQLFPGGIEAAALSSAGTLSLRELPLSWPLPDWNRWLPSIHPQDAWGREFTDSEVFRQYQALRRLPAGEELTRGWNAFHVAWHDRWKGPKARELEAAGWTAELARRHYAAGLWQLVKTWEIVQERALDGGPASRLPGGEARSWPPATITAVGADAAWTPSRALGLGRAQAAYLRNAWPVLAAIVAPGDRRRAGHWPVPWSQLLYLGAELRRRVDLPEPARMLGVLTKAMQEADNGVGPDDPERGWSLEVADPTWLARPDLEPTWQALRVDERVRITEAFLASWLDRSRAFPASQYARGPRFALDPEDHVPRPGFEGRRFADRLRASLPVWARLGVDPGLLRQVQELASELWPRGDWRLP